MKEKFILAIKHHLNDFMTSNYFQVYATRGKLYFIDLAFELTDNIVGPEWGQCAKEMDSKYDNCVYDQVHKHLEKRYQCTVPFLPPKGQICEGKSEEKMEEIVQFYERVVSSRLRNYCSAPCSTMEVISEFCPIKLRKKSFFV